MKTQIACLTLYSNYHTFPLINKGQEITQEPISNSLRSLSSPSYHVILTRIVSVSSQSKFQIRLQRRVGPTVHRPYSATLSESENERQKIEPVPIPLPRASRNFPDVKTRNEIFFHNWTSKIIPFIRFGMQMDRT